MFLTTAAKTRIQMNTLLLIVFTLFCGPFEIKISIWILPYSKIATKLHDMYQI